jgi:Rieske Fe-S protein
MLISRRALLKGSAAAAAAVGSGAIVVGCGNNVDPAPITTPQPVDGTTGLVSITVADFLDLVPVGGAITVRLQSPVMAPSFRVPPAVLLIHRKQDEYVCVDSACTHASCPLGYSKQDDLIECPCHGSRFSAVEDDNGHCVGDVVHLPAMEPPTAYPANESLTRQGVVEIDIGKPKACSALPPVMNGTVTIPVAGTPLASPGGAVTGAVLGLADPIVVVRVDANTFAALNATCTHMCCAVKYDPTNKNLLCPCHGSTFDLEGHVTGPPAPRDIQTYPVTFDGTNAVVDVTGHVLAMCTK